MVPKWRPVTNASSNSLTIGQIEINMQVRQNSNHITSRLPINQATDISINIIFDGKLITWILNQGK